MSDLSHIAIQSALIQDWEQAVQINQEILAQQSSDIEAMCRLAYAHSQLHHIDEAKKIYRKVLSLDKYHPIAKKNYERLSTLSSDTKQRDPSSPVRISPQLFLEEPGKTKSVLLHNVAPISTLCHLRIGDMVTLFAKKHSVEVRDKDKTYLGALPDDIAFRLIRFLHAGNTYDVHIKNVHKNTVSVFIRETKRAKKVSIATFALMNMNNGDYQSTRRHIKPEKDQTDLSEESDDSEEE